MKALATASGVVIYEDGLRVYISKRPANWTSTFLFVTGLLTVIVFINALLQLFVLKESGGSTKAGMILAIVAAFFAVLFWRAWLYRKKINSLPFNELPTIAVLDFGTNNLLDGHYNILSPLQHAWLERKMQITSSSPELILRWNGGAVSLVKGNPFSGGIAEIEKVLLAKGIRKK